MTKRPPKARDWDKDPATFEERQQMIAHRKSHMRKLSRQIKRDAFNLIEALLMPKSDPAHAGVYLHVHVEAHACAAGARIVGGRLVPRAHEGHEAVGNHGVHFANKVGAKRHDAHVAADMVECPAYLQCFDHVGDAEKFDPLLDEHTAGPFVTVAVGVCFHRGEDCRVAAHKGAHRAHVVPERIEINFGPRPHQPLVAGGIGRRRRRRRRYWARRLR